MKVQELFSICHKLQFLMKYCAVAGSRRTTVARNLGCSTAAWEARCIAA